MLARLNVISDTPNNPANSFCVMPFSRHTSLIRNSIYAIRYWFYNCKDNQSNVKCIVVCKNKYLASIFSAEIFGVHKHLLYICAVEINIKSI